MWDTLITANRSGSNAIAILVKTMADKLSQCESLLVSPLCTTYGVTVVHSVRQIWQHVI